MAGVDLPTLASLLGHEYLDDNALCASGGTAQARGDFQTRSFQVAEAVKLAQKSQEGATNLATLGPIN